jgi:hypothetical protein
MDFVHEAADSFVVEVETDFGRDCDGDSHRRMDFGEVVLLGVGNQSFHDVDLCHDPVGEKLNESGNVHMEVNGRGNVADGHLEVGHMFEGVVVLAVEVER